MQVKGEINAPISLSIHPNCGMPNGHSTDNEKGLSACVKLAQFVVGMEYFSMRELGQTGVEMHYCSGEDRSIGFESPPKKKTPILVVVVVWKILTLEVVYFYAMHITKKFDIGSVC